MEMYLILSCKVSWLNVNVHPDECQVSASEVAPLAVSPALWYMWGRINEGLFLKPWSVRDDWVDQVTIQVQSYKDVIKFPSYRWTPCNVCCLYDIQATHNPQPLERSKRQLFSWFTIVNWLQKFQVKLNNNSIPLRDSLRPQMMQPWKIRQFPGGRCSDPIHKTTPQYASSPSV